MKEINNFQNQYKKLITDFDFIKLELELQTVNIFEILKTEKAEIRHSNFIAWLLNPKGQHGLGDYFLKRFLIDISLHEKCEELQIQDIHSLLLRDIKVYREWNNIDLLLLNNDFAIIIENKIFHNETKNQLRKYENIVEENFDSKKIIKVFLTIDGYEAEESNEFVNYSYESILKIFDDILLIKKDLTDKVKIYLEDYIYNFKKNIMGKSELNVLADKIYQNHRQLFDFITENKSDIFSPIKEIIERKIVTKGYELRTKHNKYTRFLTKALRNVLPEGLSGYWETGDLFLFEVYYYKNANKIQVYCTIGDYTDERKDKLFDIMKSIRTKSSIPKGAAFFKNRDFNLKNYDEYVGDKFNEKISDDILDYISKIVPEIENLILENRNNLLQNISSN